MTRTLEQVVYRDPIDSLMERVAELEQAALNGTAVEDRVAELEKLVGMMRHVIDVAVLRVEPYPDDSKAVQFDIHGRGCSVHSGGACDCDPGDIDLADIDDSPLAPAE